jgi:hypothetical protein
LEKKNFPHHTPHPFPHLPAIHFFFCCLLIVAGFEVHHEYLRDGSLDINSIKFIKLDFLIENQEKYI